MFILVMIGWVAIAAGGLAAWAGFNTGEMIWAAMGLSSAISGVLFLALDRGLTLLSEIRDALAVPQPRKPARATSFDDAMLDDD
ncbi:hypothetical protein [Actibacterium sp. D379-3]